MANKNPSTRVITIPAQFLPLIEKERVRRGCFSQHETMGHILTAYFNSNGKPDPLSQATPGQEPVLKGSKGQ